MISAFLHGPAVGRKENLKSQFLTSETKMPVRSSETNEQTKIMLFQGFVVEVKGVRMILVFGLLGITFFRALGAVDTGEFFPSLDLIIRRDINTITNTWVYNK